MAHPLHFDFQPAHLADRELIHCWLKQPHVAEWFYGQGLKNTLDHLDAFFEGSSSSEYWVAYDKGNPFAFFITSSIRKPIDPLTRFCKKKGDAITLDMLIGDTNYLGKGLASLLIEEFLLKKFPQATEVLIDPEASNLRAIHVYKKVGFVIVETFIPSHSPNPHFMMHLDLEKQIAGK
ncbi:MAG: GNAT family N-acetyltransferase [Chlamydiales bacterium]|nr:GNAT family N-acetyltransferase [Chlamydiales bacterium]